jgi:quercetin dioxygenase-like cupin family protein
MKVRIGRLAATSTVALFIATLALAQDSALEPARMAPEDLDWGEGAEVVVVDIAGDNETPGMYAYRVRFQEGFRNQPHFHPDDRIVTIISGTLDMGYGERFDEGMMRRLPTGSVWTEPGDQPHFVWAQDGEVVIQVIGIGPSGTTQVEQ